MTIGIGFETLRGSGTNWRAGAVYFSDLLHALRTTFPNELRLWLVEALHGTPVPDELKPLAEGVVAYPALHRMSVTWALNHARHRFLHQELLPDRVLKQQGVDVLFCGLLERHTTIPTLALLPDFQHIHLPNLFSAEEIEWRNREYRKTAERASRVIVFSETVQRDVQHFAPALAYKTRVVPPVSFIPESVYARPPGEILGKYALPEKFVYLPNQFWQHKNHILALEAVRHLKQMNPSVFLVCTGNPVDFRNAGYFSDVLQMISRSGIRENTALLGSVPREDVFALMRQAAFVLNPSRFEGYGLSLAEANALGKRVLASDLPPHREQNVPRITYFDPGDVNDLTAKFGALWAECAAGPDQALEAQARQTQPERIRAYAQQFMSIVQEVHT